MDNPFIHVEIETTNLCNTRCLHCPREALNRPLGKMNEVTYRVIMDKVMTYTSNFCVVYSGMGEPLLNPKIYEFIKYVAQNGRTAIITNGLVLTPRNIQLLINAGLSQINVSFNGAEKSLYEVMMGGINFERAKVHLENAVEMTKGTQTSVGSNVVVTRQTQDHLKSIKNYLEDIGVEHIYFSKCHNRGGHLTGDLVCDTPPSPGKSYRCDLFKNIIFVSWTGEVLSCYHDLAGENVIGDLKIEAIETILKRKRNIVAEGVEFEICRECNDLYKWCDDRTPDRRPLSDWVYDLYTDSENFDLLSESCLSEWLYKLYNQKNQTNRFFKSLIIHIQEQDRLIDALQQKILTLHE